MQHSICFKIKYKIVFVFFSQKRIYSNQYLKPITPVPQNKNKNGTTTVRDFNSTGIKLS